uniref:Uncharacterized protein n=1 Tax=Brachypodium sylvaticum TaxID=29664 RepID=A1YKF3_BRASY|nr:hypothetical protein 57h21.17 [Brachypodium sylvaticum]
MMTVAESRRSRRLQTSPSPPPPELLQARSRRIRCSSCTRRTVRLTGASTSVKGSSHIPTSKINILPQIPSLSSSSSSFLVDSGVKQPVVVWFATTTTNLTALMNQSIRATTMIDSPATTSPSTHCHLSYGRSKR